jgi:uncharacterized protein
VLWTAVGFRLFHLPNIFLGVGLVKIVHVVMAVLSDSLLYAFRGQFGVIWPAIVARGGGDISTFLSDRFP